MAILILNIKNSNINLYRHAQKPVYFLMQGYLLAAGWWEEFLVLVCYWDKTDWNNSWNTQPLLLEELLLLPSTIIQIPWSDVRWSQKEVHNVKTWVWGRTDRVSSDNQIGEERNVVLTGTWGTQRNPPPWDKCKVMSFLANYWSIKIIGSIEELMLV